MPFKRPSSASPRRGIERAVSRLEQLDRDSLLRLAERLSGDRALLDAILQSLQEAVIVTDRWGEIEIINPSAEKILGLQSADARPHLWRAVPELAKLLNVGRDGSLTLAAPLSHQFEIHYPAPRIARLYAAPLGERILIVLSDQTLELQASARQVEDARLNSLTQLSAGVAHELGNPLNALQIHLQLLERELKKIPAASKSSKIAKSLQTSQAEVTRLDNIIRNFLQAIRPTPAHLQPTDIINTLEEVLSFLHEELEGAGIRVEVKIPGILPSVMADVEQLKQVYFNIIKNAREASPSGSTLVIEATADDEFLHVRFTDSGFGIAEEDLARLFEPYHTTKPGGTGLGMMIAQKIMRAHHGSIRVESQSQRGTTVTLSFPLQFRRFKPLAAPGPSTTPPPASI